MSKKNFTTLSREECLIVWKQVYQNSNQKWILSKSIAKTKDYGTAISLAIISIEELIKSIIIAFDARGFEFRKVKGMNSFFKNHEIRFLLAFIIFSVQILGEDAVRIFQKIVSNQQTMSYWKNLFETDKKAFEKKVSFWLLRKAVLFRNELKWFSKVEIFRQQGFYADYNNYLKLPLKIEESEYDGVITRLQKVRNFGRLFFILFEREDKDFIDYFKRAASETKLKNYYLSIEKAFDSMHKNKQKPFEAFVSEFDFLFIK